MNKIKFLKEEKIELNGITYRPYKVCELPTSFGMYEEDENGNKYPLITEWFNYKGYTYIVE
tara:strand:- start:177 stop:359 length:183 start_codon:yes stop_codon:yes gene_type:complete